MNPIIDLVAGIFKPISDVIDHIVMSGDDKAKLQAQVIGGQIAAASQALDYETKLMQAQADNIKAEAQGNGVLQRNWRPITMLTFLALVVCDSFGWLHSPLAPQAWSLLQIGLGGYVVGRSVEKIAPAITSAIKGK